jgi:tRNA(Ser,Leu) C12 N-acetylase TAN1
VAVTGALGDNAGGSSERDDMREWNVLATSLEGRRPALLAALRPLGVFWGAGYRNVLVGRVDDRDAFLDRVRQRLPGDPLLEGSLTKIVPVEQVARFEPAVLCETVVRALVPAGARLAGKTFYVRLERRGFKGVVHTPTVERAVGEALLDAASGHGAAARVRFEDPDVIVALETTGSTVGIGFLTRELRVRFPFVRVP